MHLETKIQGIIGDFYKNKSGQELPTDQIQVQKTKKEFEGDLTVVVFPFTKVTRTSPEKTAEELAHHLSAKLGEIASYNIIKGFLNLSLSENYWKSVYHTIANDQSFGILPVSTDTEPVMVEYSSPNTNKPLHLGHIRNNLLGHAVCQILGANGKKVIKTNLVNDRGIHICKSMLAWQKWGQGATPQSTGKKGDHLIGEFYVLFDKEYKKQIAELIAGGMTEDFAKKNAPLILEAQELLRKWEAHDPDTYSLWQTMNGWVYDGFNETYRRMGIGFDHIYYESDTYLLGKETVAEGLAKNVFYKKEDSSVWIDLTSDGLDNKLLLRADGTSVYMTQDIGTAIRRHKDHPFGQLVYVVGNEQEYHFKVLSLILQKLGYDWAGKLYHLSYGMVELPEGKMKSREGTVVDADDLMDEMLATAREMANELGKLDGFPEEEKNDIYRIISLGALKYFILKVDPRKNMTFDPRESIDFNGNTGPFIQYTYARIRSVLTKAGCTTSPTPVVQFDLNEKERGLLCRLSEFPEVVAEAGKTFSPALIANYAYELAKEYNQFYHDYSILKAESDSARDFRVSLSDIVARILSQAMNLLGIEMPKRM